MMQKVTTNILRRESTGKDYYLLTLGNPFEAAVLPGQFVMISPAGIKEPFLKRPYSIYRCFTRSQDNPEGEIQLLIRIVGRGSRQMSEMPVGTPVEIVGPLGKPFRIPENLQRAVFVAGGIGVAPFVELAASPALKNVDKVALIGGRSREDIQAVHDLEDLGVTVRVATEDGSQGHKGFVTVILEELISEGLAKTDQIYCCGPEPMMKAVGKISGLNGLPCQVSLEAVMGCGFGVCLGCVVKDKDGHYIRVCREGPVLDADSLEEYSGKEDR